MMKRIKESISKIDPNRTYSVSDIQKEDLFVWLPGKKNLSVYVNILLDDMLNENLLKTKIIGRNTHRRYKVEGKNLIKFLQDRKKSL